MSHTSREMTIQENKKKKFRLHELQKERDQVHRQGKHISHSISINIPTYIV